MFVFLMRPSLLLLLLVSLMAEVLAALEQTGSNHLATAS